MFFTAFLASLGFFFAQVVFPILMGVAILVLVIGGIAITYYTVKGYRWCCRSLATFMGFIK